MQFSKFIVKSAISAAPGVANAFWKIIYPRTNLHLRSLVHRSADKADDANTRKAVFSDIYEKDNWGNAESVSGYGSTLFNTQIIRKKLPLILMQKRITSVLDAPCGDFNWMRHVDLGGASYIGADIVPELVEKLKTKYADGSRSFQIMDIVEGPIPQVDFWLCRDTLFHLSVEDGLSVIRNAIRSTKWFATTTHSFVNSNTDTYAGGFRFINLMRPPYSLPTPDIIFDDFLAPMPPQQLAVWSTEKLRSRLI